MATAATDVIAFGVSAISDVGGLYAQNTHSLVRYREAVTHAGLATERGFACSRDDVRRRGVITQLMCNFHVDLGAQGERNSPANWPGCGSWSAKAWSPCAGRRSRSRHWEGSSYETWPRSSMRI
jgi:hypothetical protein